MKHQVKKNCIAVLLGITMLVALASCGRKKEEATEAPDQDYIGSVSENTIILNQSGRIMEIAVEDYSGLTYKPEEVKSFIRNEIDTFNREKGAVKVSFLQMKQEGDVIKTAISYNDIASYNAFNNLDMKLTVYSAETANKVASEEAKKRAAAEPKKEISDAELAEAGYDASSMEESEKESLVEEKAVTAAFKDGSGNAVGSDAIDVNENMMLITNEKLNIRLEGGKILYGNDHAEVKEGVARTDGEGTAIVVLFLGI